MDYQKEYSTSLKMVFAKIKFFTHVGKRKGSLKVIMLESTILIPYLKYLYLLCFDLIAVVEFALEICVCIYPKFFFFFRRLCVLERNQST